MKKNATVPLLSKRAASVPSSFIRDILKAAGKANVISFAGGLPEPSLFPNAALAKSAYRVLMNHGASALQYTSTEGYAPLRQWIAERYRRQQKIPIDPDQILITSGSQQALDLISKLFLDPGDTVVVERPTYLGALQCFSQYQPEILEVHLNDDGPDADELKGLTQWQPVKLFYTIPNYQNPTGKKHSLSSRIHTAATIAQSGTFIIEDDPYGEIRFEGELLPSLHSLLPEQTLLLGTFSKMIAPGLRVGWIIAPKEMIQKLTVLKQASDLHSSHVDQQILYDYLTRNDIEEHLAEVRRLYKKRRDIMIRAIKENFPNTVRYTIPEGGMFLWLEFAPSLSARKVLDVCLKEGIIFVPGETFYASEPAINTARFNFSNTEEEKMLFALKKLGQLLQQEESSVAKVKWWAVP